MIENKEPWELSGKRYNSLNSFLKKKFGEAVYRISLDAGFTCPNRDGTKGAGGCYYCGDSGSRAEYVKPALSIPGQILMGKEIIGRKYGAKKFLAYFQAYTNTYGKTEELYSLYKSALAFQEICGIAVGTRPDCVDEEKLSMLSELAGETFLIMEYGAQSMNDATLDKINRGHKAADTAWAVAQTKKKGNIHVVAHLILGLPGETEQDMLDSVRGLVCLGVDGFKFHHLYVEKNSFFEKDLKENKLTLLKRDEYLNLLLKIIPILPRNIVLHRLFGECDKDRLLAPLWTLEKPNNISFLDRLLNERNTIQGMSPMESPCAETRYAPSQE